MNLLKKYNNQITGYIFISPAVILISLFGIFPVFFWFLYELSQMESF